jgi:nucleoside-diphosphate-sugar epimerase
LKDLPKSLVTAMAADVTIPASLPPAIRGASSVLFLASARKRYSSKGSDSASIDSFEDVEHLGLINVAQECIAARVPRLVIVSSACAKCKTGGKDGGAATDKSTGMMCDQCSSKRAGEDAVRELYAQAALPGVGYTIVRPGLLNTGERRGVGEVEINQGESKTGVISRLDLADLLIAAASSPAASGATFECYYRDTAQPVDIRASLGRCKELGKSTQECFFGAGFKDKAPKSLAEALSTPVTGTLFASGREHQGARWEDLFVGLEPDGVREMDILDLGYGQS